MSLPIPVGRQLEVLHLPARGHFVVLGTAGSGKTTLAILRAAYLADPSTDHAGRTLLLTFNKALVAYLRHLQPRSAPNITTENYHLFARGYLNSRGRMTPKGICGPNPRETLIASAVQAVAAQYPHQPLFQLPTDFFFEEIKWISDHGLFSREDYLVAERSGRDGLPLNRVRREAVFDVFDEYRTRREALGKPYDWDNLATAVCEEFDRDPTSRRYRHVVIDEGQDFSPEMLRSLTKAIPPDGSLTFFGDAAQQIYGTRISWRSLGLSVTNRWNFTQNYRNTRQIARLALALSRMPYFRGIPDIIEPVAPTADGPLPTVVRFGSRDDEVDLVLEQAARLSRTRSVAILLRNRADEGLIVRRLPAGAIRLHRDMTTWETGARLRYGTYHSAKGLEFDFVILPFLSNERLPDPDYVAAFGLENASTHDGKLLYVGITRAKAGLILTYTGDPTSLLPPNSDLYERITW
jgi:superfamily I DNA/RNA helicase